MLFISAVFSYYDLIDHRERGKVVIGLIFTNVSCTCIPLESRNLCSHYGDLSKSYESQRCGVLLRKKGTAPRVED